MLFRVWPRLFRATSTVEPGTAGAAVSSVRRAEIRREDLLSLESDPDQPPGAEVRNLPPAFRFRVPLSYARSRRYPFIREIAPSLPTVRTNDIRGKRRERSPSASKRTVRSVVFVL